MHGSKKLYLHITFKFIINIDFPSAFPLSSLDFGIKISWHLFHTKIYWILMTLFDFQVVNPCIWAFASMSKVALNWLGLALDVKDLYIFESRVL